MADIILNTLLVASPIVGWAFLALGEWVNDTIKARNNS